ncbi:MAG: DUF362 domain-containing protein [Candidatus Aminicenantales bacterium]
MGDHRSKDFWSRRNFLKFSAAGLTSFLSGAFRGEADAAPLSKSPIYWVDHIPDKPFLHPAQPNHHAGVDALLKLQAKNGLKFFRTTASTPLGGPNGLIASNDVVLIKVNAQWKYRGCTNSDVIRGLVQRILDHPEGFRGEVVIMENGQGVGSLACDNTNHYNGDTTVNANANDPNQSFLYLVNSIFHDRRVTAKLLDPVRKTFLTAKDHVHDGYRTYENVSYPCFTSDGGHRIELREGLWNGKAYVPKLKLINVPVLKHHGGSEITASLKHLYGVLSMADGNSSIRHYDKLGEACGKMVVSVRTPVLNIIDAIWVSQASTIGYPASTTFRANTLVSSQDPVALDFFSAKYVLYPINKNPRHYPTFPSMSAWLNQARNLINARGGLYKPLMGIQVGSVHTNEKYMKVYYNAI